MCSRLIIGLVALSLTGCAIDTHLLDQRSDANKLPEFVELSETPFFPQKQYQCAPAALATVLSYSGVSVRPDDLVSKVFIPERRGSLQIELLAATRGLDRLPYVIQPDVTALMSEVAAGQPVLVLQNLGLSFAPVWHYAVVIGYDAVEDQVILRTGTSMRRVMPAAKFARTWSKGENWAMIALRPGELPATPIEVDYLKAAAALESAGRVDAAKEAFRVAVERWPHSSRSWFGLANAYYASGDLANAESTYRRILIRAPDDVAALNNLAQVLLDQDRCSDSIEVISRASSQTHATSTLADVVAETGRTIETQCSATPSRQAEDG